VGGGDKTTVMQALYLDYAASFRAAGRDKGKPDPEVNLRDPSAPPGSLDGRFRIAQVLSPTSCILDKVSGEYDRTEYSVRVQGISMTGKVDGEFVGLPPDMVFVSDGTWSYPTVTGAKRTIFSISTLDAKLFKWAQAQVDAPFRAKAAAKREEKTKLDAARAAEKAKLDATQAAEKASHDTELAAAKKQVDDIAAELAGLEGQSARVKDYMAQADVIRAYERNINGDPNVAALVEEKRAKLNALGVKPEDVEVYKAKAAEIRRRLEEAKKKFWALGGVG
jgi:hypothetical protein